MKIYFIGICGTATGNVAILMKRLGNEVAGSDLGMYEPMKSALENAGVAAFEGWDPKRLEKFSPDLVVVGNAISRMNPELEFVLSSEKYKYDSLPSTIGNFLIGSRPSLVVSGTHGKTTTSSIAAFLLNSNGIDAGWLIGGIPLGLPEGGSKLGNFENKTPFAIEGDEYDSAFFDKRSKFLHYRPRVLLINNIEFDHADIFRDLEDVKRTFTHVRRIVSPNGFIIENADDENIASLEASPWTKRMTVGVSPNADVQISDFNEGREGSSFTLSSGGVSKKVSWKLGGIYNARNAAMAAVGVAKILGKENPLDINLDCLANFEGVKRRQEIILDTPRIVAVEDFAHHPTAISLAIEGLRKKYPDFKIFACFEPRSNTAKRKIFQNEFAQALLSSDIAFVGEADSSKIPENMRMNTREMAALNPDKILACASNAELLEKLISLVDSDSQKIACVFFSNGSFDSIHKKFAQIYAK